MTFDGFATFFQVIPHSQVAILESAAPDSFFPPFDRNVILWSETIRHAEFKGNGFKGPKNPVSSARDFRCCRPFVSTATAQGCAGRPCQSGQSSDTWPQSLAKVISQSVTCLCHLGRPQWTCSADSSPTESGRQILGNSSFTPCFDTYSLETRQFFPTSTIKVCRIPPSVFPINGISGSIKKPSVIIYTADGIKAGQDELLGHVNPFYEPLSPCQRFIWLSGPDVGAG